MKQGGGTMAEVEYPKGREKYFFNRFTRLMLKTAVPYRYGTDVAMLLTLVASTEDVARYKRPVAFFNEAIKDILGIRKDDTLRRIRAAAVDSGWLAYQPSPNKGDRRPGLYWVVIPDEAEGIDDCPLDDPAIPDEVSDKPNVHVRETGEVGGYYLTLDLNHNHKSSCSEVAQQPSKPKRTKPEAIIPERPAETVLDFKCNGLTKVWYLVKPQVDIWQVSFPGINAMQQCRAAHAWNEAAGAKRKTATGMMKFLVAWLVRAQNDATRSGAPPPRQQQFKQHVPDADEANRRGYNPQTGLG